MAATKNPAKAAAEAAVVNAPQRPTASSKPRGHAGGKVVVCSKLPMAIELQLCEAHTERVTNRGEHWDEKVFAKVGQVVVIAGAAYPVGAPPEGTEWPDRPAMSNGAALTFGVDKDFWEAWLEQNKTSPMVVNKMIFAQDSVEDARAEAREYKALDSGLGPLKPDSDRRMPKKLRTNPMNRPVSEDDAAADLAAAE